MPSLKLISLLFTILFKLPSLIGTITSIMNLIKGMKDKDLFGNVGTLGEILRLILSIIPLDKSVAKDALNDLKSNLEQGKPLDTLKDEIKAKKQRCEGNFCPADLK